MGLRFNPPPNWPPPPPGFVPPPRWQPDPAWPPPPPGWQVWVDDSLPGDHADLAGGQAGLAGGPRDGLAGRPGNGFAGGPGNGFAGGPGGGFAGRADLAGRGDFTGRAPTAVAASGPPEDSAEDRLGDPFHPYSDQTNGWAIAAFVLGMIGGTILSFILAIVALRQIRERGQRGKGLAITGLVFSVLWSAVLVGYLFVYNPGPSAQPPASAGSHSPSSPSASSPASSPSAGHSGSSGSGGSHDHSGSKTQTANVFGLRAGQCFQNPSASESVLGITSVTVVPCTTPHDAQVFAEFPATGTSYPGTTALRSQADQGCHARLSGRVVNSKITGTMSLRYLYPLVTSWASGHKTISCLIVDAKPDLKSSLLR